MKMLFDFRTKGHHIEYIHHLYMMMVENKKESYMIVVPEDFKERGKEYEWPESENIKFDFISTKQSEKSEEGNFLLSAYRKTFLLKKYVKKHRPTDVFLITLIAFIPFLPFMISKSIHVSGIIYKIYLYEWSTYSVFRKIIEIIKYKSITFDNCLSHVLILNDSSAAAKFNKLYKTKKFKYLVDPYNKTDYVPNSVRDEMGIPSSDTIFLHFGSMNRRKGTLTILQAISLIPEEKVKDITIIVAGIVQNDIKKEFYELLKTVNKYCRIIVYDDFSAKSFIEDLCQTCDFILLPYGVTAQSSGLIAYAANSQKPVIGPTQGLIGKLIRKNHLGLQLDVITPENLAKAMAEAVPYLTNSNYSKEASIEVFKMQIGALF